MNQSKFYYCEDYKCGYYESYMPMENETSAGKEIASHKNLVNLDNEKRENDELEKMILMIGLHVHQCIIKIKMIHLSLLIIIDITIHKKGIVFEIWVMTFNVLTY